MQKALEKLMRKWMPDDIQDKMREQRKEAEARLREKRKEAKAEIRDMRKEAEAQLREKRKEAKSRIRETHRAARGERSNTGGSLIGLLLGALGGAVMMYFLDPRGGARRRALLRDQIVRLTNKGQDALEDAGGAASRVTDRARGSMIETRARIEEHRSDEAIPSQQLEARVRSELGRYVQHLGAVDIRATDGVVTLSGAVLAGEVEDLIKAARGVRGVKSIENKLTVYERPEDIPALQG